MQLSDYEFWIDANLPPTLAIKIQDDFKVKAFSMFFLNLHLASDIEIFNLAKSKSNIIIITKDDDFINLVLLKKPPPLIIWLTIGNVTNKKLFEILKQNFINLFENLISSQNPFIQLEN
jgi:predicted nuclease of predicted toxin-antitoxin system